MRMWAKPASTVMLLIAAMVLVAGCSSREGPVVGESSSLEISTEPVTIRLGVGAGSGLTDSFFQQTAGEVLRKKHPNITVEFMKDAKGAEDRNIDNWLAAGIVPDIIAESNLRLGNLAEYDLLMDMTPLLKATGVDLSRFDPILIDAVRSTTDKGWVTALPYGQNLSALYYNKVIFDRFGVPYPKDGMTWEDTLELARKVARMDNGVQYVGLQPGSAIRPSFPLSLNVVDPGTNKANVISDQWKQVFELLHQIASIPGTMVNGSMVGQNDFWTKRNVAMMANVNRVASATADFTEWDLAQYPSYTEQPNVYGMVDSWVLAVTKTSKLPQQAMQVINAVTSDEAQLAAAKQAQMSTLVNPLMKQHFAEDLPALKGKHVAGIFKSKPAPFPKFSPYYVEARALLEANLNKYLRGEIDLNTALRLSDEEINKMLATKQSGK